MVKSGYTQPHTDEKVDTAKPYSAKMQGHPPAKKYDLDNIPTDLDEQKAFLQHIHDNKDLVKDPRVQKFMHVTFENYKNDIMKKHGVTEESLGISPDEFEKEIEKVMENKLKSAKLSSD